METLNYQDLYANCQRVGALNYGIGPRVADHLIPAWLYPALCLAAVKSANVFNYVQIHHRGLRLAAPAPMVCLRADGGEFLIGTESPECEWVIVFSRTKVA